LHQIFHALQRQLVSLDGNFEVLHDEIRSGRAVLLGLDDLPVALQLFLLLLGGIALRIREADWKEHSERYNAENSLHDAPPGKCGFVGLSCQAAPSPALKRRRTSSGVTS